MLGRFAEGLRFVKGAFRFVPVKRSFGVGLFFVLRDAHGKVVFLFDVRQAALAYATGPTTLIHGDVVGHRENLRLLTYARLMFVLLPFLRAVALHHVVRFGVSQLKPGIRARRDVDRVGANGAGPNLGFLGPRVLFDLLSVCALGTGVRHGVLAKTLRRGRVRGRGRVGVNSASFGWVEGRRSKRQRVFHPGSHNCFV